MVATDLEGTLTLGESRGLARYLAYVQDGKGRRAYRRCAWRPGAGDAAGAGGAARLAGHPRPLAARLHHPPGGAHPGRAAPVRVGGGHELWPRRQALLAELERYQRAGYRLVLASGTYQPVLDAFSRRLDAVALGTPLEMRTGRPLGACWGRSTPGRWLPLLGGCLVLRL